MVLEIYTKSLIINVRSFMRKTYNYNKQGFTIIEVVLVLGIAGLIFLMMFMKMVVQRLM